MLKSYKTTESVCTKCSSSYEHAKYYKGTGMCKKCVREKLSKERTGKNNPNYKDGKASWEKYKKPSRSKYTVLHFKACKKYRAAFLDEHGYPFCEVCHRSDKRTEVHHIYYASLWPRHKHLHDFRNLVMVCVQCHNNFHSGKYKDVHATLESERGLKELFS